VRKTVETIETNNHHVALGSLVVARLPLDSRFARLNPAEDDGIFKFDKIPQQDLILRGNKAVCPM
jgi:hypothetical protein